MPTPLIYALVVLIWGTTWYTIKFQLGVVAPEISLVYRFGLAAVCVFIYARATGSPLKLSLQGPPHGRAAGRHALLPELLDDLPLDAVPDERPRGGAVHVDHLLQHREREG